MAKRKPSKTAPAKAAPKPAPADLDHIAADLRPLAVPIDTLVLDPANAREHSQQNITAIAASLRQFGQRKPVVANRKNAQIEAGNGTLLAARQLGWTDIAVVWVEDDPAAQTGFAIADNRSSELATWNDLKLAELLGGVKRATPDLHDALLLAKLEDRAKRRLEAESEKETGNQPLPETFEVVVTCTDETDQKAFFDRMKAEGRKCRVLTL